MSKAVPHPNRKASEKKKDAPPAPVFKPPLKPRWGVFYALLGSLALWIVALVVLYVRTVYPTRGQHSTPERIETPPVEKTIPR